MSTPCSKRIRLAEQQSQQQSQSVDNDRIMVINEMEIMESTGNGINYESIYYDNETFY